MNNPLGVSPSKGKQGTTRGKEKNLLTSVGIEHTTSGLDVPLLCLGWFPVLPQRSEILETLSKMRPHDHESIQS